jgi:AraC-like DNA-binding protein
LVWSILKYSGMFAVYSCDLTVCGVCFVPMPARQSFLILHKIHSLLSGYILSGRLEGGAMPTEEYCADALHLSPCYFRDLLKFETGKSMHEYFQLMRLDMAKKMLRNKDYTVGMTARKLGYANSQHFTCLFKKITGMTPTEYKYAQN